MGFIASLFRKELSIQDKLDLAEILFDSLKLSAGIRLSSSKIQKIAKPIIEKANNRHEVLDKILKLCSNIKEPHAYYLTGTAYVWKGAKFRKDAINYLEKYSTNPSEALCGGSYLRGGKFVEQTLEMHLHYVYQNLGKAYEGEYDFDKALLYYIKAKESDPYVESSYIHIAEIYSKLGDLDKSIETLKAVQQSEYYKDDNSFKVIIDSYLKEFTDKKERGYIYRPKRRHKK
jgi:tetratricopeptide (TPR) repeat protein